VYEKFEGNYAKEIYKVKTKDNFTKIPLDYLGKLNVFFKFVANPQDVIILHSMTVQKP